MGLYVQTLEDITNQTIIERDYYLYLLEYNWNEPIGEALSDNYPSLAKLASENKSIIIRSEKRSHFANEVLSWHNINGENAEKLLPAILITNKHPSYFKIGELTNSESSLEREFKFILIPLREVCNDTNDMINLIQQIFNDIKEKKEISNFKISKELKKGFGKALVDALILEPNFSGIGINLKSFNKFFKK